MGKRNSQQICNSVKMCKISDALTIGRSYFKKMSVRKRTNEQCFGNANFAQKLLNQKAKNKRRDKPNWLRY